MIDTLKAILRSMGQGLLHQDAGELVPTERKMAMLQRRGQRYRLSGGQGSVVLIAGNDPLGHAFDFAVEMAGSHGHRIEVLYLTPDGYSKPTLDGLLQRLTERGQDFQVTFHSGDLLEKMLDYGNQRQDVLAVVCSASGALAGKLRQIPKRLDARIPGAFPSVLLVGDSLSA